MGVLLVDVGNTRVKWARLQNGRMDAQRAAVVTHWATEDYARRIIGRKSPQRIVISSVAGDGVDRKLIAAARQANAPAPEFVRSERHAAGVSTEYLEPWRLGVDRFVAAIGAHHLGAGEPTVVASIGTAVTVDLVDGTGLHRGGSIIPGPALMVLSLLKQTHGIRRRASGGSVGGRNLFATTTRGAISQGALHAVAATIDRAVQEGLTLLGRRPIVLVTGGGAKVIKPLVSSCCVVVPDLVLHGLAVWSRDHPAC